MWIYFLGIGGMAMGNLAILLQSLGYEICGSDQKIYPPMSDLLEKNKINIYNGYSAQRLEKLNPDLVVIGNTISRGNEEVEWLLDCKKIPYCSLPELIRQKIIGNRDVIAITGTHGKTTTTTLLAYLFSFNHCDPGYFIGGVPINFPSGACYGKNNSPLIIEGDEYDSAFFDKRSKFIHYSPKILVMNNIEFDHLDIFHDLRDIQRTFSHLIKLIPSNGCIIANGDSMTIRELLPVSWTKTIFVGKNNDNDFIIGDENLTPQGSTFTLSDRKNTATMIQSPLFGTHNVRNVAMAIVATWQYMKRGLNIDLSHFKGIKKRQEVIFNDRNTTIVEDFAHHPTAIAETIHATKQAFPTHRLITVFEPRSHTACSNYFQEDFIESFMGSDEIYIAEVYRNKTQRLDTCKLARDIHYCPAQTANIDTIKATFLKKINQEKQVFLFLSNGNFANIAQYLKDSLELPH
ncbi:MAG: Mur ligase domain-containing protein [Puniceicoccales bacterium]|jgi:UDP-N-acetylmuramate: L-alanyl-gamma-D-glutamyl-meso-diaminopimelate ligase|nr:Mur ligase domain-containing protein [Puniceicoccales bacterium]